MSDVPPEPGRAPSQPDPSRTRVLPPDREPPGPQPRFVDRVWSFRALIAVALAAVLLGGLGGAAIANAGNDSDNRRGGPFPGHMQQRPGNPMVPPWDGRRMPPPGYQQWQWNDGLHRRGMGQRQWDQDRNPLLIPPTPTPAKPSPSPQG